MEKARERHELLRAIGEAMEEHKSTFGLVPLSEQAAPSLRAKREGGFGSLECVKFFDRCLVIACGLGNRNKIGHAPKPPAKEDNATEQHKQKETVRFHGWR